MCESAIEDPHRVDCCTRLHGDTARVRASARRVWARRSKDGGTPTARSRKAREMEEGEEKRRALHPEASADIPFPLAGEAEVTSASTAILRARRRLARVTRVGCHAHRAEERQFGFGFDWGRQFVFPPSSPPAHLFEAKIKRPAQRLLNHFVLLLFFQVLWFTRLFVGVLALLDI
ncbi:hypothetical protein C8J57DRAFT_1539579 [Mycena rebaudengoi]|nr:hypothetical protein C8J57DRAFT_1539579 [Mycena rebaudengoi]